MRLIYLKRKFSACMVAYKNLAVTLSFKPARIISLSFWQSTGIRIMPISYAHCMNNQPSTKNQTSEFYDLSERLLNSGDAYWGNLGYWQAGDDYSTACEGLAHQLANAVNLNQDSRILDVGFGCGDQLLLWLKDYNIQFLCGINYSVSQTVLAKQRLKQFELRQFELSQSQANTDGTNLGSSDNIFQGDVADLKNGLAVVCSEANNDINTILALDCAYHFPSRKNFFDDSFKVLKSSAKTNQDNNGIKASTACIGLTDIVLADAPLSWGRRMLLNIMLSASRIPKDNIVTLAEYQGQLQQAGFDCIASEDISEFVFEPFGNWLKSSKDAVHKLRGHRSAGLKYRVTAAFLAWAYRNEVLRYIVISARISSPVSE